MENGILTYQTEGGDTRIKIRLESEDVLLSQIPMMILYQTTKQNSSLHLKNIFKEDELNEELTVKDYLTVQQEGSRFIKRAIKYADNRPCYFKKNTTSCIKNWYLCTNSTRHATHRTAYQGESFAFKTFYFRIAITL